LLTTRLISLLAEDLLRKRQTAQRLTRCSKEKCRLRVKITNILTILCCKRTAGQGEATS